MPNFKQIDEVDSLDYVQHLHQMYSKFGPTHPKTVRALKAAASDTGADRRAPDSDVKHYLGKVVKAETDIDKKAAGDAASASARARDMAARILRRERSDHERAPTGQIKKLARTSTHTLVPAEVGSLRQAAADSTKRLKTGKVPQMDDADSCVRTLTALELLI